ncbi:MAG: hypothetical protein ACR2P2_21450 [Nakamurella sp.]
MDPTSRSWRVLRGGIFALVSAQLAALGHLVGGGMLPSPTVVLGGGGLIALAAILLARRQRGFVGIFSLLAASQLPFHLLFSATANMCTMPADSAAASMSRMSGMSGMSAIGRSVAAQGMCGGFDGARMIAFHAIAAALTALVLAHGDTVLFRLAAIWLRALRKPLIPPLAAASTAGWSVRRSTRSILPAGAALVRHPRRGPPVLLSI